MPLSSVQPTPSGRTTGNPSSPARIHRGSRPAAPSRIARRPRFPSRINRAPTGSSRSARSRKGAAALGDRLVGPAFLRKSPVDRQHPGRGQPIARRCTEWTIPAVSRSSCPTANWDCVIPRRAAPSPARNSTIGHSAGRGLPRIAIVDRGTPRVSSRPAATSLRPRRSPGMAYSLAAQQDQQLRLPSSKATRLARRLCSLLCDSRLDLCEVRAHQHDVVLRPQRKVPVQV
jgi:hypothetical protein